MVVVRLQESHTGLTNPLKWACKREYKIVILQNKICVILQKQKQQQEFYTSTPLGQGGGNRGRRRMQKFPLPSPMDLQAPKPTIPKQQGDKKFQKSQELAARQGQATQEAHKPPFLPPPKRLTQADPACLDLEASPTVPQASLERKVLELPVSLSQWGLLPRKCG